MAYIPHTWKRGELITAEKMNNMEEGAAEASRMLNQIKGEIAEAAAEALKTIPEDYSAVTQDVKTLKEKESRSPVRFANSLTNKVSGIDVISVTDAWEAPVVNLEVDGASEQVVTTGAQLFDSENKIIIYTGGGITMTREDGAIVVNGTATATPTVIRIPLREKIPAGTQVTIAANNPTTGYVGTHIRLQDDSGTSMCATNFNSINSTNTETLKMDAYDFAFRCAEGETFKNFKIKPMINTGATPLPWEPYTGGKPSPSPEYPQEIVSVAHVANSGAQLFDASRIPTKTAGGATVTNNGDGSFTISGSGTISANYDNTLKLSASEASELFDKPGNYTFSGGPSTPYVALKIDKPGENIVNVALSTIPDKTFTLTQDAVDTIKDGSATVKIGFYALADKAITPGTIRPMLAASITPIPWEPYNGQQREIDLPVMITGGNLIDTTKFISYYEGTYTIQDDGRYITVTGSKRFSGIGYFIPPELVAGKKITVSGNVDNKNISVIQINIHLADGTYQHVQVPSRKTLSIPDDIQDISVRLFANSRDTDLDSPNTATFSDVMVSYDANAGWEPYKGYQKVTIPLTEPLLGIGDVKDRFCMRDGVWGIERQFVKIVLDGSENWGKEPTSNTEKFRFKNSGYDVIKAEEQQSKPIKILCNRLAAGSSSNTYNCAECISSNMAGEIYIYMDAFSSGDVDAFNAYLTEHPITAIFELATPTWEPFPESTQADLNALATHPGTTYLTVTSTDVSAPVRLEYVQDTRKVIDSLKLDMAEQMVELQAQIDQLKVTNNLA